MWLPACSRRLRRKPIHQFKGMNTSPEWSNDGRFLAYLSTREVPAPIPTPRPVIAIQSMQTGQVREVFPTLSYVFMGRWSPDDRLFIARGADLKGRSGIVKIDTSTGESHARRSKRNMLRNSLLVPWRFDLLLLRLCKTGNSRSRPRRECSESIFRLGSGSGCLA